MFIYQFLAESFDCKFIGSDSCSNKNILPLIWYKGFVPHTSSNQNAISQKVDVKGEHANLFCLFANCTFWAHSYIANSANSLCVPVRKSQKGNFLN